MRTGSNRPTFRSPNFQMGLVICNSVDLQILFKVLLSLQIQSVQEYAHKASTTAPSKSQLWLFKPLISMSCYVFLIERFRYNLSYLWIMIIHKMLLRCLSEGLLTSAGEEVLSLIDPGYYYIEIFCTRVLGTWERAQVVLKKARFMPHDSSKFLYSTPSHSLNPLLSSWRLAP